jgi:hypothetical protein
LQLFLVVAHLGAAENSSQMVQIKIGSILATNQTDEFDPRLKSLEKQLKVLKYKSYRLLKEESQNVAWHGIATFDIPGGRKVFVNPQEFKDKQLALRVRMQEGQKPLVNTIVKLQNGGHFLLGGPPHESGVLVVSIWATLQ